MKYRLIFILILFIPAVHLPAEAQKQAKKIIISGKVVDKNYQPLQGVMILIDNIKTDTETDKNGFYKIRVSPRAKYITVVSIRNGMKESMINGQTIINFELKPANPQDVSQLKNDQGDETVDVAYGIMKKKDLTSKVSKVNGQNLKFASYTNIYDMIKSEVPGVRTDGKTIYLVEPSSIINSIEPLIVVDGMPVTSLDGIEPSMVKSISILKGASASIYGARGANGVILITLKRGETIK